MSPDTKPLPVLAASWGITGFSAVLGSVLGSGLGQVGLFAGATLGGIAGVAVAVAIVRSLAWLPAADTRGAIIGGVSGFAIAAPIAVFNLHTPVIPVFICSLVGVGVLLGAGVARGWRRS